MSDDRAARDAEAQRSSVGQPGAAESGDAPRPLPAHDFGGRGSLIHLAHANGYPPGTYRAMVAPLLTHHRVLGLPARPFWPGADWQAFEHWRQLGDDLLAGLDRIGAASVIGIGHSLGGVATMYAATLQPERFRALILIEPVLLPPMALRIFELGLHHAVERIPLVRGARQRRDRWPSREAAFAHLRPKPVFARIPDAVLWDYVEHGLVPDGAAAAELTLACPRDWEARIYATPPTDVWRVLPRLLPPTLALRGADSDTISTASWHKWQRLQPQARFVELDGLGHLLCFEDPGRVAAEIERFLEDLARDSAATAP